MRTLTTAVMLLLLAVLHTPRPAQALFFDFLPSDLLRFSTNEPVMLLLTGVALLSLGRLGAHRGRTTDADHRALPSAPPTPARQLRRAAHPAGTKRAA